MVSRILILLLSPFLAISCRQSAIPLNRPDINRIRTDLERITKTEKSRNHKNIDILNVTAAYIHSELSKQCDTVFYQTFVVDNKEYKNVIGSLGSQNSERIIIGAHYDVAGEQDGADDNASGVVGLLESARILSKENLDYRIDFVAYSLEEPPYYASTNMGSYIHAKSMYDERILVKGMICLEMIGYFSDEPNSQHYPQPFFRWFYGNKGDFITVVQKYNNGSFGKKAKKLMTRQKLLPAKSFTGLEKLQGIDFSDHRNYWKFGYSAVMITNTAFYRNPNYHQITDKMETLDLERMGKVIEELCVCVVNL